jgi:hypothetical protein
VEGSMRRSVCAIIIVAMGVLCAGVRSHAESDAAANKTQGVRAADSSKASAGFAGKDSCSSLDENNLNLTANNFRPRTCKNRRGGRHSAIDRRIQERG